MQKATLIQGGFYKPAVPVGMTNRHYNFLSE